MALSWKHTQTQNNNKFRHRSHTRNTRNTHNPRHHVTQRKRDRVLHANNFYLWANQKWLREVPKTLPRELKYIRPLDNFKLIQDEMYRNVLEMISDYTRPNSGNGIIAREMKNIITSFRELRPEPILKHISEFCKLYNELVQENNIYKFLGVLNQNEMIRWAVPICWNVYPDEYTPNKLSAHIGSPSLSLYDYRFYMSDKNIAKKMRGVRLNTSATTIVREDQIGGGDPPSSKVYADTDAESDGIGNTDTDTGGPETKTVEYIEYKRRITRAFMRFIDDVFTKCLGKDYEKTHHINAQDVYDVECLLLSHMNHIDARFDESYANIYQTAKHPDKPPHLSDESSADMSERLKTPHYKHNIRGSTRVLTRDAMELTGIDWREMAKWIGYKVNDDMGPPPYFIAYQVGYLKSVMTCLKKEWASDKWKSYWYFIYMRQLICFHDKWREIYLDFNDTLIRGKDTHFPREYVPILGLAYTFPKTMSLEFTRRFKNEDMCTKVREIGNTILECFKKRIENNTWMSAYTKKGALKKLNTLDIRIGESNLSAPDPVNLEYDPKDAWGNLIKRSVQRTEYIARHHHSPSSASSASSALSLEDLDIMNWGTMKLVGYQSFVVNAYYTAQTNSIYIPTAYMHSLNVQFGRGYEYDLASVGFTFGHEISHSLHVSSRVYDYRGVIKNWWSRDDVATYERKIAAIRHQYETISRKSGFIIDGNLSLPENLADITGLSVCEDALNQFYDGVPGSVGADADAPPHNHPRPRTVEMDLTRSMAFHRLFTYYAIQNRQYANHREILVQVLTNPHLDLKIRTNVPLMRSKTFREVFGIKKNDKMYNDDFDTVF